MVEKTHKVINYQGRTIALKYEDPEEKNLAWTPKIRTCLDRIRAREEAEMLSVGIVLAVFKKSNYQEAYSLEQIAEQVNDGKWFKSSADGKPNYGALKHTLDLMTSSKEEERLLVLYPDGKYGIFDKNIP